MNFFAKLKNGLAKTRNRIEEFVSEGEELTEEFFEHLEDALISADVGYELTLDIIDELRKDVEEFEVTTVPDAMNFLKSILVKEINVQKTLFEFPPKPWVIVVIGVNGVGKTTTIGKLAYLLKNEGKKVMLGAADTFRAGAIEQLKVWAERTGSDFVAQHEGADAASVAYDALDAAKARGADTLILDTAGRLHTKINLMKELEKIFRVIKKNVPHAPNEILLVVDATTGQNAIKQAEMFHKTIGLTGLIVTKLDGTAKGGIALALARKFKIPVKYIGVGEGIDDLQPFDPKAYVDAMLGDFHKK